MTELASMPCFEQVRRTGSALFPAPEPGEVVEQNPPALVWLRHKPDVAYTVIVETEAGEPVLRQECPDNVAILNQALATGTYRWNVYCEEEQRGWHTFTVPENAVEYVVPSAKAILAAVPEDRPRHIFMDEDRDSIHERCEVSMPALQKTIDLAVEQGMPKPPTHHLHADWHLRYREGFGRHRDYCDRNLVACALGHRLLGESDPKRAEDARAYAKACLITICDWNPSGPCGQIDGWGDEFALSHARCLPSVFDWCYDLLSDQERTYVARTIEQYALQCEERIKKTNFITTPGNSHVGRIPAYLGEAALVLKGSHVSDAVCERWLQTALDIYGSMFPFFGGRDGGWAEGVFYGSSYTKWYLPFFLAVERIHGFSFLNRPFYQKVSQFFMHFAPPGWESHPFSDGYWCQSTDEEWPGFMAQNPFRVYAERFGPDLARDFDHTCSQQSHLQLHLLDVFTPKPPAMNGSLTGEVSNHRLFRDAGLASMHSDIRRPNTDVAVLARASKFGSVSHQHADQGNFAIISGGTTLITPSGYFGAACGSTHHQHWTNATKAHNCVLIDGEGQARNSHEAVGKMVSLTEEQGVMTLVMDLSQAYESVEFYQRIIRFDSNGSAKTVDVEDDIRLTSAKPIQWRLHALSKPTSNNGAVTVERKGQRCGVVLHDDAAIYSVTDQFDTDVNQGVADMHRVERDNQYHMQWELPAREQHQIRTTITIN